MTGLNLDEMLARVTTLNAPNTTQARTYLTDALGSVIAQTQDNQSTLAGYSYSPYGQTQSTGNTEGDSVQYTGRENDNNGLYYYRARYYDPVLKRFLSEDPIGLAGGSLSFYTYVEGNPISGKDPTGLANDGGRSMFSPQDRSDTSACAYYQKLCQQTGCRYYCYTAPIMCNAGAFTFPGFWTVRGRELNCIRRCLVREDAAARQRQQSEQCKESSCLPDSTID